MLCIDMKQLYYDALILIILLFLRSCSDYDNSYSFSSPTDDWPSMSVTETTLDAASAAAVKSHMRKGPLRSIKRAAGRFKDILIQ